MTKFRVWASYSDGSYGFIIFDWWLCIKAPWNAPVYSEVYGGDPWRQLGRGWRWRFRKIKRFL